MRCNGVWFVSASDAATAKILTSITLGNPPRRMRGVEGNHSGLPPFSSTPRCVRYFRRLDLTHADRTSRAERQYRARRVGNNFVRDGTRYMRGRAGHSLRRVDTENDQVGTECEGNLHDLFCLGA